MSAFLFCDKLVPYEIRAKDLIDRMTLAEKVKQMGDNSTGVFRLGLPPYEWWSEILHGVASTGFGTKFTKEVPGATSFPTVILTAATFNESLWKLIGQVSSTEARAMYNLGTAGLTFWSPNINVVRDPRWGRTLETPGEDPFVIGTYSINFVRGLQDIEGFVDVPNPNSRPLKIGGCCKHYTAYDIDKWYEVDRHSYDAKVAERDMVETFNRPFEMCIREGDVVSVMCSFNNVNGIPACSDPKLLRETIRGEWGLNGYIVSDCYSMDVIVHNQTWLGDSNEDVIAQSLNAGLDLECGWYFQDYGENATMIGRIKEGDIDRALKNNYVVLMRLGFFDGIPSLESLGKKDICSDEHIELAADAARQGIVMLKNDNQTLPLSSSTVKNIAVVGPNGNVTVTMIGNYAGIPCKYTSPKDGFSKYGNVTFVKSCGDGTACTETDDFPAAVEAANNADATIIVAGLDLGFEREEFDRDDLKLPGQQTDLINQVSNAAKGGPVILVVMSGGCIDISFAKNNPKIQSILWVGYPGEEGGRAIADVVFGNHNPSGKLPVTWYTNDYTDKLPMNSMSLRPVPEFGYPGRTYKFFKGETLYPFGYGLSYTQFQYSMESSGKALHLKLGRLQHCRDLAYEDGAASPPCPAVVVDDINCGKELEFEVDVQVQNVGKMDGSEVVIVYSKPPEGVVETHIKQVIGFQKVFLKAGESKTLKFTFNGCKSLMLVDKTAYKVLPSGEHMIVVGDEELFLPVQVNIQSNQN
ncbi:beta-xylosidase/alpha-L-arabinofuranosidase 1-like [Telopea speciosissima]|uniref:beta-xylosidase/alpha-L-arabinofuranosidase 1-like n=1 Tax=Telopea speciosissima TaxID=54955 RepID=UPI001CC414A4|nr:beta-xylosidase/alpha-L-arabinofuranosidase 1-like [Telopea speciosissima]